MSQFTQTADLTFGTTALDAATPSGLEACITQAITVTGRGNLVIGETGWGTTSSQVPWFQEARMACNLLGLPEPSPGCLFDLQASAQYAAQNFGLYDSAGNIKPVGTFYLTSPLGKFGQ